MVLTDREIQVAIRERQIRVDPEPGPDRYSSTSLDLTLARPIRIWDTSIQPGADPWALRPGTPGYDHNALVEKFSTRLELTDEGYLMKPRDFILAWTVERVELPPPARLAARVEGKSSFARCAIAVHITAPTIHSGFKGQIQLEICNIGPLHVRLIPGVPICQLIFEQTLGTPDKGYSGQFSGQGTI
ncbi:MAG TPA: dCTP deaminase [Armatimonadota bacterium]|nr:dCTP deaminase [Armatimonadota bacterium]